MSASKTTLSPYSRWFLVRWRDPGLTSPGLHRTWADNASGSNACTNAQVKQVSQNTTTDTKRLKSPSKPTSKKACTQYLNNILCQSLEEGNNKPIWSYVRGQREDNVGVYPLKKAGQLHSDRREKYEILADQFSSVFTKDCHDPIEILLYMVPLTHLSVNLLSERSESASC